VTVSAISLVIPVSTSFVSTFVTVFVLFCCWINKLMMMMMNIVCIAWWYWKLSCQATGPNCENCSHAAISTSSEVDKRLKFTTTWSRRRVGSAWKASQWRRECSVYNDVVWLALQSQTERSVARPAGPSHQAELLCSSLRGSQSLSRPRNCSVDIQAYSFGNAEACQSF